MPLTGSHTAGDTGHVSDHNQIDTNIATNTTNIATNAAGITRATYLARSGSAARGLPLVASRFAATSASAGGIGTSQTTRIQHTAISACADPRMLFTTPISAEVDHDTPIFIKAAVEYNGVIVPVTFGGKQTGTLDQAGASLLSDPAPIELPAAATFYSRTFVSNAFGASTTLAGASIIGATSLTLTVAPPASFVAPALLVVDTGGNKEVVTVTAISGTTLTIAAAAKAHASGVIVGQSLPVNSPVFSDTGDAVSGNIDLSYSGTVASLGTTSTTLAAATIIGATSITIPAVAGGGPTLTIDTAGNAETATIKNVYFNATNYTVAFTTTLTKAHASGVTVVGAGGNSGYGPSAVVADQAQSPLPGVVIVGDSLAAGQGNLLRSSTLGFIGMALLGTRPFMTVAKGGETAQTFAALANSFRRRKSLSVVSPGWAVVQYGVNDVFGGRTAAQLEADVTTIMQFLKLRGLKVAVTTLTPRTTSTDLWATIVNQTIATGDGNRQTYNAWVRAGAGGLADLILDVSDYVESARNSGLWKAADATYGNYTTDGSHPTYWAHSLVAAGINPALFV